jgi:galactokinase
VRTINIGLIQKTFKELFPQSPTPITVAAPGRVNLLGEHTDYNDGFVFPMAIDNQMVLVGAPNHTNQVHLYSMDFAAHDVFSLDDIQLTKTNSWSNYIRGVCVMLMNAGYSLEGMNIVLQGNVPQGAGLSSSAALEVATASLIDEIHELRADRIELVKLAQKAENDFVGVNCGIMDQFISMMGKADHALFLDCRTLEYELIPAQFEKMGYSVVVVNSSVKRGLVDSEYNTRRAQCESAVEALQPHIPGIKKLRDVTIGHLDLINTLPTDLAKRARHVVTENQRVLDGVKALQNSNLKLFGELLYASHESLRDDYEVSCKELDLLVEIARSIPGTLGSRMTGAGFGGCTVSLVAHDAVDDFRTTICEQYSKQTGIKPETFVFKASDGARRL